MMQRHNGGPPLTAATVAAMRRQRQLAKNGWLAIESVMRRRVLTLERQFPGGIFAAELSRPERGPLARAIRVRRAYLTSPWSSGIGYAAALCAAAQGGTP